MTITNTPLSTDLQAEVERVLALSELAISSDGDDPVRQIFRQAAAGLIMKHGPTIAALAERLAVAEERVRVLGNMLDPVLDQLTVANKRLQALTKVAEPFARFNGSENPMRPEIDALRGMIANLSSGTPTNRKYREARMAGAEALARYDAGEGK